MTQKLPLKYVFARFASVTVNLGPTFLSGDVDDYGDDDDDDDDNDDDDDDGNTPSSHNSKGGSSDDEPDDGATGRHH